jgi:hydroxymethylpyrimidine pyrophosphatase-like HAD family hydrolase
MIHLSKRGISKAVGVEFCINEAGLTHDEIIVSGDAKSDLCLFEGFSFSIAPANSCRDVVSKAGFCAANPFGIGFCEGLEHYRKLGHLTLETV